MLADADTKSRNIYEAIQEGLGDSLDKIKGQGSMTKVSGLAGVTLCMVVSPEEVRNTERGRGLRGRELINSSVSSLWDIQVEMSSSPLGGRSQLKTQILEAFTSSCRLKP